MPTDQTADAIGVPELSESLSHLAEQLEQHQSETVSMFQQFHEHIAMLAQQIEALQNGDPTPSGDNSSSAESISGGEAAPQSVAVESVAVEPVVEPIAAMEPVAVPQPTPVVPVATAVTAVAPAYDDSKLGNIIFGDELAGDDRLRGDRAQLIQGLLTGDEEAMALAGQLLIFRASDAETMPQMLKGLGEAYYAWRPQTSRIDDPFRDAIIAWLHRECDAVGVTNRIELVRQGDRFDSKRHQSKERGVEVSEVHGWLVVRKMETPTLKLRFLFSNAVCEFK